MSVVVFPYYHIDQIADLARYFKEKNALKAEDAINIEPIEWITIVSSGLTDEKQLLKRYPFLKKTESNKIWFDVSTYKEYQKKWHVWGKRLYGLFQLDFFYFSSF